MFHYLSQETHSELTFDEANIIAFNIYGSNGIPYLTLDAFMIRMDDLYHNTTDPYLRRSVLSIQKKISRLTPAEYEQLCIDCSDGKVIFPPNYTPPNIDAHNEQL